MCARLLRAGGLPDSGGTPATVIVTIDQADLLADLARAGVFDAEGRGRVVATDDRSEAAARVRAVGSERGLQAVSG